MWLYQTFYGAQNDRETFGAMFWHQSIGAALLPLVAMVEIAFRNRMHHALSMLHGGQASGPWYGGGRNHMRLKTRIQRRIDDLWNLKDDAGHRLIQSVDDFISESTFGLWIEVAYELQPDRRYRFCKLVIPGYPLLADRAAWTAPGRSWMPLVRRFERHKAFRDCIAHHRPLWKIPFEPAVGVSSILPSGPGALLLSLRHQATALRASLEQMEPGLVDFWDGPRRVAFDQLTTLASLHASMGRSHPPPPAAADAA